MPATRLSMRKVREVLRQKWACGLSHRRIAQSCGISRETVAEYVRRAAQVGLSWPLPPALSDGELERLLFPGARIERAEPRAMPDWAWGHRELKRKGVTLLLLWEEYKATHPEGYHYSWFCQQYQSWRGKLEVVMRQSHRAGEVLFVDYAGQTIPIVDRATGELRQAQLFVAVLGASNYTYAEATWSQTLPDWIGSHVRTFAYLGGVPAILVPDNLKSGVTTAHRYEPELNPTYQEMSVHYGVAVVPARVRKPRDKAKVEQGVLLVERWIVARLRYCQFFSLAELNQTLRTLLQDLNHRPFKKLPGCRQTWFETLDQPALRPLPAQPYEFAEWKRARVNIDYHIEFDGHYYSVPYQLVKQAVEVRATATTIEILHRGQRVASHRRSPLKGRHTTITAHMPAVHQAQVEWTPQRLIHWAEQTGPATAQVVSHILATRVHPQQGFRSCLGLLRLGKRYGQSRLEAACRRAVTLQAYSYKSVESILKHGLDQQPLSAAEPATPQAPLTHENLRGAGYYH